MNLDFEVSISNTMQAILGSIVAISSFGVSYIAQLIFPVTPVTESDLLLSQSTIGTVNIYSKEELQQQHKTPRELIDIYMQRKANLQDVIEVVTGKSTLSEAYVQLGLMEQTPEIQFLIKAAQTNYNMK